MNLEEMQDQLDLLNKTVQEQKEQLAAAQNVKVETDKQLAAAKEAAQKAAPADYEDIKKSLQQKEKDIVQLQGQLTLTELKQKYPDVNFELVPSGSKDQMEAFASKLQGMIDAKMATIKPANDAGANLGKRWEKVPPGGGTDRDLQEQVELQQGAHKKIEDAKKNNDPLGVMDACMEAQPKATAKLFASLKQ